jgi:hypothetical protein
VLRHLPDRCARPGSSARKHLYRRVQSQLARLWKQVDAAHPELEGLHAGSNASGPATSLHAVPLAEDNAAAWAFLKLG